MHIRSVFTLGLAISAFLLSDAVSAEIYKTVDKDGNVVFTDIPPSDDTQAVRLDTYNSYSPAVGASIGSPSGSAVPARERAQTDQDVRAVYDQITISSPGHDETVRDNAGNLTITAEASPALDTSAGHTLRILLDGEVAAETASTTATLTNVDRGTHQLSAQITNASGEILVESTPIEFHLLRYSVLTGPNKQK